MTTELKSITDALDLEALLPEEQEEILLELNSLVFKGSLLRLIERMDEKTKEDFNALMDTEPKEEVVLEFLESRVPEVDKAVTETLEELTSDILAVTS